MDKVEAALTAKKSGIDSKQVQRLTGTLRGLERDRLATEDDVFARFLSKPKADARPGTVFLVCTSAGEVGLDLSADHMLCDLTTLDAAAQRLGRVNRRGDGAAEIDVFDESDPDPKRKDDPLEQARWTTLELLRRLPPCDRTADRLDGGPLALGRLIRALPRETRNAAFAPVPTILPTTDILFDAWALTTIRDGLPGRPKVEPYLHGIDGWEPPQTQVAWRDEVSLWAGTLDGKALTDLLADYPLKPHELLRDRTDRVFKELVAIAARRPDDPVWLVEPAGAVRTDLLKNVVAKDRKIDKNKKTGIEGVTVVLPPSAGGLRDGRLDGEAADGTGLDVSDQWFVELPKDGSPGIRRRGRVRSDDPKPPDAATATDGRCGWCESSIFDRTKRTTAKARTDLRRTTANAPWRTADPGDGTSVHSRPMTPGRGQRWARSACGITPTTSNAGRISSPASSCRTAPTFGRRSSWRRSSTISARIGTCGSAASAIRSRRIRKGGSPNQAGIGSRFRGCRRTATSSAR